MANSWGDLINFSGITDQDVREIVGHNDDNGNQVDPTHSEHSDAARRAILRLYTLETPLYRTLNKANSCKDTRVIDTLGPFAHLLFWSVVYPPKANELTQKKARDQTTNKLTLYRGLGLPEDAIQTYRHLRMTGADFSFTSFTSTSTEKGMALEFAY